MLYWNIKQRKEREIAATVPSYLERKPNLP